MSNLLIKIDTKFGDDIEVLDVIDIDTLRTNCGHRGAHISRSSLTCNLCNKLAGHYGYYENDKNNWPLILFCIDCGNNWIVCKICIQCKPILSPKSFKLHNRRKHSCSDAKSLNSKKRSQKEISTDYDTCPDATSLNSNKRSQKEIGTDYDTVSKEIYDFFHREDNEDILYYYHDISNNGLKYLMDRSRGLTGKSL